MLRLFMKNVKLTRTFASKGIPAPDTNPPVLYSGVSKNMWIIYKYIIININKRI